MVYFNIVSSQEHFDENGKRGTNPYDLTNITQLKQLKEEIYKYKYIRTVCPIMRK